MENKYPCSKCNSENTKLISEPIEIEKNCSFLFIVVFFIFVIISIAGLVITIKSIVNLQTITINTTNYEETINAIVDYYKKTQEAKTGLYIGLIIFAIGLLPQIIIAMVHSLATKYSVKNELKIICLDCKHKMNYLKYTEQENENQTSSSGN